METTVSSCGPTAEESSVSEFDTIFKFSVSGILLTFISVLGVTGNVISLIILSNKQMRSSINCCLQALATFDTGVLITATLMLGLPTLAKRFDWLSWYRRDAYPSAILVLYPLALIAQTGSVWTTVAVTVERYVAVCHPLRARIVCTYSRARIYILFLTLFAVCYNIPRWWEIERRPYTDPSNNFTRMVIVPTTFRNNKVYFEVYFIWLYLFVMYFLPFLALAILNSAIWKALRNSNKNRKRMSSSQEKEVSLAMLLLCVVTIFFVCNVLTLVVNIMEYFDRQIDLLVIVSNLLVVINSSVNLIIYCIFGQKFKKLFLSMFCAVCLSKSDDCYDSVHCSTVDLRLINSKRNARNNFD